MRCPFCQSDDTKVLDTRLLDDGSQVRRRRECLACGERHSTRETVDLNLPRLIKSDDSRQSFSENKLRSGLLKALEKRPVETSKVEMAIQKIQRKLMLLRNFLIQRKHKVLSTELQQHQTILDLKQILQLEYQYETDQFQFQYNSFYFH